MKCTQLVLLAICVALLAIVPRASMAATLLSVDARQAPPAPETGYLHFGTSVSPTGGTIGVNNQYLTLDGKPWLPVMGEFHFTRFPNQYWEEELQKMKAAGVDIVATYIIWNHIEENEGKFIWTGDRDLRQFVTLCGKLGLKVVVRPGPWAHSEARFGGIPDWVVRAGPTRSNDPTYLHYVARFLGEIDNQLKGLLWKDGGPVIGVQLENEYHPEDAALGREHIATLKKIAVDAGLDVPLYTVTGWDNTVYPQREVTPVFGGYADEPWGLTTEKLAPAETYSFRFFSRVRGNVDPASPNRPGGDGDAYSAHTPFLGAEFGGGVPTMYRRRPIMKPDDVAAMLPVELGSGVNLYGYYMFHGGQNSPDHGSLEENTGIGAYNDLPLIDYDFQAPLGAYGQQHGVMNKIRPFHYFLQAFGPDLAQMAVHVPSQAQRNAKDLTTPRFSVRSLGDIGFLFVNNYVRQYDMATQKSVQFAIALPNETVTLPRQAIDIPNGAYFIWPLNMDLAGARLIYATAQPVTRIGPAEAAVYVFHAQDGIAAEFAISDNGVASVTTDAGQVVHENTRFIVSDLHAGTNATIDIKLSAGNAVRLVVLTIAQADRLSLVDIAGSSHIVLTDAQLFSDGEGLNLLSTGDPTFRFEIFPRLANPPKGEPALTAAKDDGLFQVFEARAARRTIRASLTKIRDAKPVPPLARTGPGNTAVEPPPETFGRSAAWTITLKPNALDGLEDAFLQVRARGDIARLYSGIKMMDDHFLDGSVWEIGLKRFTQEIKAPLTLAVLPMRKDAPIYLDAGVDAMVSGDQTADVIDARVIPQYRLHISN